MFQNVWFVATIWMSLAFAASLISIWTGISVALIEILVGVAAGNFLQLHATTEWINFLATLGSGVLTFLAGAEIDPISLKANLRASMLIGVISFAAFLFLKLATKTAGVWPLARLHYMRKREAAFTTLLMATGLTFGTISALFGLQNKIINQSQYSILVSVVILSAFVPTLIAQKLFQPNVKTSCESPEDPLISDR